MPETAKYVHKRPPYGGIHERRCVVMQDIERNHHMMLRLSDNEYQILRAKTYHTNAPSMSFALRQMIVESKVYEVDYSELREISTQLAKIGNNINQIARRINETRSIYQTDINEIKKEFEEICRLQGSMLSRQP